MKTRRKISCPRGTIRRKAYTRKDGVHVKSSCIRDRGKPGKGPRLFTLKKGGLSKYGYHMKDNAEKRHKALKKALKHNSYASIVRKINALSILMKNTEPYLSKKAKADLKWLKTQEK